MKMFWDNETDDDLITYISMEEGGDKSLYFEEKLYKPLTEIASWMFHAHGFKHFADDENYEWIADCVTYLYISGMPNYDPLKGGGYSFFMQVAYFYFAGRLKKVINNKETSVDISTFGDKGIYEMGEDDELHIELSDNELIYNKRLDALLLVLEEDENNALYKVLFKVIMNPPNTIKSRNTLVSYLVKALGINRRRVRARLLKLIKRVKETM